MDRVWSWKWLLEGVVVLLCLGFALFVRAKRVSLVAWGWAPERYAPRFGGFCAFAVSKGFTAA